MSYCNPVYDRYFADPFVVRTDDGYVAIGTGAIVDGLTFELVKSPDLVHWTSLRGALRTPPAEMGTDCWAPEVVYRDGRWWMYYSVGHDDKAHQLRVAVSDDLLGPYEDCGVNLAPQERFAIDPHPFLDLDGTWYLFFAHDVLEGERVGTMVAVAVLEDMTTLRGEPRTIVPPSADWQLFLADREMYGQVYDWHTIEGPFVVARNGRYYCFFSGGNWQTEGYGLAYAVADHPLGPWSEPSQRPPLLTTVPGKVLGPGHASVVTTHGGQDVFVYHAWDPQQTRRSMFIDRLTWTLDGPEVDGPSWEPREL